jgi:prevent-host-death family protein
MDEIPTAEARRQLAELVNRVAYAKERLVLTRHGRAVAALVPIEDLTLLERIQARLRGRSVERALREAEEGQTVSWDSLRADLDL